MSASTTLGDACLIGIADVSRLLNCSRRHVYRLVQDQRMPAPVKVGRLNRWSRQTVERWICDGCPPAKTGGRS